MKMQIGRFDGLHSVEEGEEVVLRGVAPLLPRLRART